MSRVMPSTPHLPEPLSKVGECGRFVIPEVVIGNPDLRCGFPITNSGMTAICVTRGIFEIGFTHLLVYFAARIQFCVLEQTPHRRLHRRIIRFLQPAAPNEYRLETGLQLGRPRTANLAKPALNPVTYHRPAKILAYGIS